MFNRFKTEEQRKAQKSQWNRSAYIRRKQRNDVKKVTRISLPGTLLGELNRYFTYVYLHKLRPWQTMNDCMAAAIRRGLSSFKEDAKTDDERHLAQQVAAELKIDAEAQAMRDERQRYMSRYENARTEIAELQRIGHDEEAAYFLHQFLDTLTNAPSSPWRNQVIKQLKAEFAQLYRANHKSPLERTFKLHDKEREVIQKERHEHERRRENKGHNGGSKHDRRKVVSLRKR